MILEAEYSHLAQFVRTAPHHQVQGKLNQSCGSGIFLQIRFQTLMFLDFESGSRLHIKMWKKSLKI